MSENYKRAMPQLAFLRLIGSRGAPSTIAPGTSLAASKAAKPSPRSLAAQHKPAREARRLRLEYRRDMDNPLGETTAPLHTATMVTPIQARLAQRDFSLLKEIKDAKKYDRVEWKTNLVLLPPNQVLTILDEPNCIGWIVQNPPAGVSPVFLGNDPTTLSKANHPGIGLYPTLTAPAEAREEDPTRAAAALYAYHTTALTTAQLRIEYCLRV